MGEGNTAHCVAEETVSTPAGSFDTKRVEYAAGDIMQTWFAAGVGSFLGVKNSGWYHDSDGSSITIVLASYHLEPAQ